MTLTRAHPLSSPLPEGQFKQKTTILGRTFSSSVSNSVNFLHSLVASLIPISKVIVQTLALDHQVRMHEGRG